MVWGLSCLSDPFAPSDHCDKNGLVSTAYNTEAAHYDCLVLCGQTLMQVNNTGSHGQTTLRPLHVYVYVTYVNKRTRLFFYKSLCIELRNIMHPEKLNTCRYD